MIELPNYKAKPNSTQREMKSEATLTGSLQRECDTVHMKK